MRYRPNLNLSAFFFITAISAFSAIACKKLEIGSNCLNDKAPCFKADKTAPKVDASLPQPNTGSTTVSVLTAIQVTFSEEMKDATNTKYYALSGSGQGSLAISSIDAISNKTVQVNLTGSVGNGPIILSFPGMTDFNGNALVAANATVTLTGNLDIGVVFEDASTTYYVSSDSTPTGGTARTSAVIKWHHVYDTDNNNSYQVKLGGSRCADAANATGTNVSGTGLVANSSVTTTLYVASNFAAAGSYIVRICLDNTDMNKSGEGVATVISIDTEPTIIASLGGGAYGGVKSVTFTCGNTCDIIAYNVDSGTTAPANPAAPTFNSGGTVLTGTLFGSTWVTPHVSDPWITKITLVAFDRAGNQSTPVTLTYTIDTNIPNITFGTPASTFNYLSGTGAAGTNASTTLTWQADKTGNYLVCLNGNGCTATPNCGTGTTLVPSTPYPVSGTVINTNISATQLAPALNGVYTVHVCVKTASQLGDATYTLVRDDTAASVLSLTPANGATGILPATKVTVNLNEAVGLNTATLITNTLTDTTCSGTFQLSADNFSTCIPMTADHPSLIGGQSYQMTPKAVLQPGQYKIRITSGVRDLAGNSLATTAQTTGFLVIGLLRQFSFNNDDTNLTDQAQTGYNLTEVGSPQKVTGVDGDANGAYRFTNPASYLTGVDTLLPSGNAARTVCAWAQSSNQCGPLCMATMYGSTLNGPYVGFWNGRAVYGVYGADLTGSSTLPILTWTHICSVYNGSVATVFVNGIQNGSSTSAWNTVLGGGLTVGRQSGGSSFELEGRVDDVRVYSGALSANDIRQMGIQEPNGLMAYYSFSDAASGTAIDYSGNGHTGFRNGAPLPAATADRFGLTGAYSFGGPSQYINAKDTNLPQAGSPRTVCSWMRPTTLPTAGQFRIAMRYGQPMTGNANYLGLYHDGTQQNIIFSAWGDHLTSPYTAATNTWMHLCGTYDGTTARLYLNGGLAASAAKTWNTTLLGDNGIVIGQGDLTGTYPFQGAVDDVRIYNRVLAESEVLALSGQLGAGLLRQYTFTGGSLSDDTGNANLTATGGPTIVTGKDGTTNSAFAFNGSTQYLSGSDAGLPMGSAARTLCAWGNLGVSSSASFLASYGTNPGTGLNSFLAISNGVDAIFGSFTNNLTSSGGFSMNSWSHICGVLDGQGMATLYINGIVAPGGGPSNIVFSTTSSGNLVIGARAPIPVVGYWAGSIDNVRIYNRALGPAEISELQGY